LKNEEGDLVKQGKMDFATHGAGGWHAAPRWHTTAPRQNRGKRSQKSAWQLNEAF
jgi:hypothetical protein